MLPSPESGAGSQARWPQAAQYSCGGMASTPHFAQRIPVSVPWRTRSKKPFSVVTASVTTEQADQHGGGVASEGVGETDPGALDLAAIGLAAELGDDFDDLGRAGGPDGVA